MNTSLKYRTFDQLLADVSTDFYSYNLEGMIRPADLIKIAQRVTYDLGVKIHTTKQCILDVEKGKVKLPDDFYVLDFALICGKYIIHSPIKISGTQTEDILYCKNCNNPNFDCSCPNDVIVCDSTEVRIRIIEKKMDEHREYTHFERLSMVPGKMVDPICPNTRFNDCAHQGEIRDGFLFTSLEHGRVFITYQGALEDDNGNLLVLDHPMINDFYEYALKHRILENLFFNGEDVEKKLSFVEAKLRESRIRALGIVNTPDFREIKETLELNRKAMYQRYYEPFKTSGYIWF